MNKQQEIDWKLRKEFTDCICLMGAALSSTKHTLMMNVHPDCDALKEHMIGLTKQLEQLQNLNNQLIELNNSEEDNSEASIIINIICLA